MSFEDLAWATFGGLIRVIGVFGRVAVWVWWLGERPSSTRHRPARASQGYRAVWRVGQVLGWALFVPFAVVALKVEYF